ERGAGQADQRAGRVGGAVDEVLEQDRPGGGAEHHRHDQVGAAAVVLFGDRGDVLDGLLVGGDRLVLGAVVGGEVAVGEGDHGGDRADRLDHALAGRGGGAVAAHQAGERQGGGGRAEDALVLERHAGGAHALTHQRQHQHRLGEFDRAAQAGDLGDEAG